MSPLIASRVPQRRVLGAVFTLLASVVGLVGTPVGAGARGGADGPSTSAIGIDANDAAAVTTAWRSIMATAPASGFTGDVASCTPGTTSQAYRTAELKTTNALRSLAGLNPLTEDATWSTMAQKTALMMAAAGALSHDPDPAWACYTADGDTGAQTSNLYLRLMGPAAQVGYIRDPGAGNDFVGHRRWMLCPYNTKIGFGDVPTANATKILGGGGVSWTTRDGFVAWPYPGIVPTNAASERGLLERFSLQVPINDTVASASVTITSSSGGAVTATQVVKSDDLYCSPAIVWVPSRAPAIGENWTIAVNGIKNAAGASYNKSWVVKFTDLDPSATVPDAPTGVSATPGNTTASVTWTAPASDGGSAITGYTITPYIGGVAQQTVDTTGTGTSKTVTGLTNGSAYTFKVAAKNALGTGAPSASSNAVTPSTNTPPGAPTGVSAVAGNAQATVTWTAPASDGGSPITGYVITPYKGATAQPAVASSGTGTSKLLTGLTNNTAYTFKVAAVNEMGTGAASAASAAVTPRAPFWPFASWAEFVTRQYTDLTNVPPSSSALSSWVASLSGGTKAKGDLIEALRRGTDNTTNVDPTARLYRAFLGRAPDAGGLRFWVNRRRSGEWTLTRMADSFAASNEFKTKYGSLTNREFVTRIYTDVLGRAADTAGVNYWTGKLDRKEKTRGQVMVGFSESSEYKRKQAENTDVAIAYVYLMGRAATTAETTDWVTRQKAGTTQAALATELLDSAKYATHIAG